MDKGNEFVKCQIEDNIAIVTIDRPPVSALNPKALYEFQSVFENLAKEPKVLVAIVTSGAKKVFVAGADIDTLRDESTHSGLTTNLRFSDTFTKIADFYRPVICAVSGMAIGGGFELAMACDIVIADESASFSCPEVNLSLIPAGGGTQRLPRLIPPGLAKELLYTGRKMKADEALRVGFVNRVVPVGEVLNAAKELAKEIASRGPQAVTMVKRVVDQGLDLPLKDGLRLEALESSLNFATPDFFEGTDAFFGKRKPDFKNETKIPG